MGVYTRPDSPFWWIYLETTRLKEKTDIVIGHTTTQRKDSRKLADDRYHQRMNEVAARLYKLPSAQPAIRFGKYAATYETDTIAHHAGARRERELVKNLRAFFEDDLLSMIDQDRVKAYHSFRAGKASARTINREVDLLKAMLRDAVPKYLTASPIVGMKRLRILPPKRRLMTSTEQTRLLKACEDAQDRAIFILGWDTLIRLGDLLDLERADRDGVWLYVKDPKGGAPYQVALSARAATALDRLPSGRYYFPKFRRAENPRDWPGSVRQRLQYLCGKAKPPLPYGRKQDGITFHWGTRRTGATRLIVQNKIPIPIVQKQGGWKTPDVLLDIYTEASTKDQLKAMRPFPLRSRTGRKRAGSRAR